MSPLRSGAGAALRAVLCVALLFGSSFVLSSCFDSKPSPVSPPSQQQGQSDRTPVPSEYPCYLPISFCFPVGPINYGDTNWYKCGSEYFTGLRHLGSDILRPVGTPVYAVANGRVVVKSSGGAWGAGNSALAIEHAFRQRDSCAPQTFVAVYGHIRTSLSNGASVRMGQVIGTVGPYAYGNHVHFGVWRGPTAEFPSWEMGRKSDPSCRGVVTKFVAPVSFLRNNFAL